MEINLQGKMTSSATWYPDIIFFIYVFLRLFNFFHLVYIGLNQTLGFM